MPRWSILCLMVNICWSLPLISQTEPVEWAPVGAKWWYNDTRGVSDPSLVIQTMESTGDTVILNTNCRILKIDLDFYDDGNQISQCWTPPIAVHPFRSYWKKMIHSHRWKHHPGYASDIHWLHTNGIPLVSMTCPSMVCWANPEPLERISRMQINKKGLSADSRFLW